MAGGAAIPVVAADPGHSRDGGGSHRDGGSRGDGGSHRDGGSRRDGGGSQRDGGSRRGGGDYERDGAGRYGQDRGERDDYRRGPTTGPNRGYGQDGGGNGRDWSRADDEDTAGSDDFVIQPSAAARAASPSLASPGGASPGVASPSLAAQDDTAVTEVSVPSLPAAPGPDSGGAAITEPNGPPFTAPPVVFGDGRTPGILSWSRASGDARPETAVGPAEILVVNMAPLVEAPPPAPAPSPPPPSPTAVRLDVAPPWQRTVASMWAAAAEPSQPGGLGFGIAGLILAPLAGVWLGYRQARASRAAAQLVDR